LRRKYEGRLDGRIHSVRFCQDNEAVWLEIDRQSNTELGIKSSTEIMNLDFIAETYEVELDIWPVGGNPYDKCIYTVDREIEDNAKEFFEDESTLENVTTLFD
jgi:hypothetical protein